jgi:hypothetical protein
MRKVFVSFHRNDYRYYEELSSKLLGEYELVQAGSRDQASHSDDIDEIISNIRQNYVARTSCTAVLVGHDTWKCKLVDWETSATLESRNGLIGIMLPTAHIDERGAIVAPKRLAANVKSGFAAWVSWTEITSSSQALAALVDQANRREKCLIGNSYPRFTSDLS